jgi:Gene product 88
MKLLSKNNAKLLKGEKLGYLTLGLSLAPHKMSGVNLCPHASAGCAAACLFSAGMGRFENVAAARIAKAKFFNEKPTEFLAQLEKEIAAGVKRAAKIGKTLAVRLNVLSDVAWERLGIIQKFPQVQFYDYTKSPFRALQFAQNRLPANYHLTFSRSESNQQAVETVAAAGVNVAVVFAGKTLPASYLGKTVVSGDESDLRFLDAKNVIVGLSSKGKAKKDESGFVVDVK